MVSKTKHNAASLGIMAGGAGLCAELGTMLAPPAPSNASRAVAAAGGGGDNGGVSSRREGELVQRVQAFLALLFCYRFLFFVGGGGPRAGGRRDAGAAGARRNVPRR